MSVVFVLYTVMFSFALVMAIRSVVFRRWNDVALYVIVACYLLIGLFGLLHWSDMGNRVGLE